MQRLFVIQAYLDRAQQIPRIWVFICPNPSIFTGMHGATNYASELQLLVGNLRTKFHEKISFDFTKPFFRAFAIPFSFSPADLDLSNRVWL